MLLPCISEAGISGLNPTLGASAAYSLYASSDGTPNALTLYDIDMETGTLMPLYYSVELTKTNYTYGDGENSVNVMVKAPTDYVDIAVFYDTNLARQKTLENQSIPSLSSGVSFGLTSSNPGSALLINTGASVGTIEMGFFNNSTTSSNGGGAMTTYKYSQITTMNADFFGNSSVSSAGGLRNGGSIVNLTGNFVGNEAGGHGGGILSVQGGITTLVGDFIGNRAGASGGAIANMANTVDGIIMGSTLNSITGDFIGNRAGTFGGAICNVSEGTINEINGLFISNTASDNGGAIFNEGKIVTINADYIGNQTIKNGGAIANNGLGIFDTIVGNFIGNTATTNGGAIWNRNIINSVSGSFMGNIANEYGGAIYQQNGATIGIIADTSSVKIMGNTDANGTANAIYQNLTTDSDNVINLNAANGQSIVINDAINGIKTLTDSANTNQININKGVSYTDMLTAEMVDLPTGGNYEINNIVAQNSVSLFNGATLKLGMNIQAGTMYYGKLDLSNPSGYECGFGFSNDENGGTLDTINEHIDEQILGETTLNSVLGISVDVDAENLVADAFNLTATAVGTMQIDNINWINSVTDFVGNIQILKNQDTTTFVELVLGDTVATPTIEVVNHTGSDDLTTNIINWDDNFGSYTYNTTITRTIGLATTDTTNDSITLNKSEVDSVKVYSPKADNLALINQYNDTMRTFDFDAETNVFSVTENTGITFGGQLTINGVANGDVRSTIDAQGHNLFQITDSTTTMVDINNTKIIGAASVAEISANNSLMLNNVEISGNTGGIANNGTIILNTNNIINNDISGSGHIVANDTVAFGANVTQGDIVISSGADVTNTGVLTIGTVNNSGIVNNNGTLIVDAIASSQNSVNTGTIAGSGTAIFKTYLDNTAGTVVNDYITVDGGLVKTAFDTFITDSVASDISVINGGEIEYVSGGATVRDISGDASSNVRFKTGSDIVLNNTITGVQVNHDGGTLIFGSGNLSSATSLNLNGGAISMADDVLGNVNLGNVNLNQKTELALDLNLGTLVIDTFGANVTNNGGIFNVSTINFQGVPTIMSGVHMHLGDMTGLGQTNVTSETFALPTVVSPIYILHGNIADGWLTYAPTDNSYSSFNPVVMAAPVAAQINGYLVMQNVSELSFADLDLYRLGEKSGIRGDNSGVWVRPFGIFETVPIKYGPNVTSELYGTMAGHESSLRNLGGDWYGMLSLDVGYTLARDVYDGITVRQNGTSVGATGMVYNGGFFAGFNMHIGYMDGHEESPYGTADFMLLNTNTATKFGYNIEMMKDVLYLQPHGKAGYTFVLPFDYINAAGTHITANPLHVLTLESGFKLAATFNDWRPYVESDVVWSLFDKVEYYANSYGLPIIRIEPYVKYGGGVEKNWGEHFTAYGKLYGMAGGRKGVEFQVGMKYKF